MTNYRDYHWLYPLVPTTRIVHAAEDGAPAFSVDEAIEIGEAIGIDWETAAFDPEDFQMGLEVELEHGSMLGPETNVTDDDPEMTGRIALAHLLESPDYYVMLADMEKQMPPEDDVTEAAYRHTAVVLREPTSGMRRAIGSLGIAARTLEIAAKALAADIDTAPPEARYLIGAQAYVLREEVKRLEQMADDIGEGTVTDECYPQD